MAILVIYGISIIVTFLRARILAGYFGDQDQTLGLFFLADRLPSIITSFLVIGVITSAFIPMATKLKRRSREGSFTFISSVINLSVLFYLVVIGIFFLFPEAITQSLFGRDLTPENTEILINLTKIIFISQIFFSIAMYFSAILQSYKRFIIFSIIPIVYNLGPIITTVFFYNKIGIYATAFGMLVGSIISIVIQIPELRQVGYVHRWTLMINDNTKKLFRLSLPRIFSISAHKVYILVVTALILKKYTNGGEYYIIIYEFANQLQNLLVNAFGATLSQILLPSLSSLFEEGATVKIRNMVAKYLMLLIYIVSPLTILMIIFKISLVRILFGGDKFSWLGTNLTAYTFAFFGISIVFQTINLVLNKVYYANYNTKSPLFINLTSYTVGILLSIFFGFTLDLGLWSFALAFSISNILQTFLLIYKLWDLLGKALITKKPELIKILYSSISVGVFGYVLFKILEDYVFNTTRTIPLIFLVSNVLVLDLVFYILVTSLLQVNTYERYIQPTLKKLARRVYLKI